MSRFKLPIGDPSGDGHSQCEYFMVESNKLTRVVESIYEDMDKKWKVGQICAEYEESQIDEETAGELEEKGLELEHFFDDDLYSHGPESMAQLVLDLLMIWDDTLELKIVDDDIKSFSVRDLPGYGIFN